MSQLRLQRRPGRPSLDVSEQKRRGVIVAALEEFARMGFHAASLRTIAEKATVSSRTLYNYFPDKLTLFEACLDYSGKKIQADLSLPDGELYSQLVFYVIKVQEQLSTPSSMQISRLIYRDSSDFDELRKIALTQFQKYQVDPVVRILHQHGCTGENIREVATQFVAMAFGEWQRRILFGGPAMTPQEVALHAELVTSIFLGGIVRALSKACAPPESAPPA